MVVGQDFVWGHLPKAAGDATLHLFRIFPELVTFADDEATNEKHTPFRDRPQQVRGRRRVLNLRRLPDWTLSYTLHKASRGLHPSYRPLPMDSPEQMAAGTAPDRLLEAFGHDRIDTWLRVESLVEDFLSFVSGLTEVDAERRRLAHGLRRVNALEYDREVRHWFTADQLERLYAANPLWRATELEVYGRLAVDSVELA